MTESIFDPTGPQTERSGTRNLGPSAQNISHMPPDLVDGDADAEEPDLAEDQDEDTQRIAQAESEAAANPKARPDKIVSSGATPRDAT